MESFWLVILSLIALPPLTSSANLSSGVHYKALSTKEARKNPELLHTYAKHFYDHHQDDSQINETENATCTTDARTGIAFAHIQLIFENRNASIASLTKKYVADHRYFLLPMYQELINALDKNAKTLRACSFNVEINGTNSTKYDGMACVQLKGKKGRECKWCRYSPFAGDTEKEATARLCKMRSKDGKMLDLNSPTVLPQLKSGSRSISGDGRKGFLIVVVALLMTLIIKYS